LLKKSENEFASEKSRVRASNASCRFANTGLPNLTAASLKIFQNLLKLIEKM
jgi:hypothetical protein